MSNLIDSYFEGVPGPIIGMIVILVMMLSFVPLMFIFEKLWNRRSY